VVIALEVHDPKGFGRVRMKRVPDMSGNSLIPFICDNVQQHSTVIADCWKGCNSLRQHGYTHKQINISKSGGPAHVHLPGAHRIASLLKRILLSTHQGAVSPKHLDNYLDEYTFRFNRRTSRARGLLFYRLLEQTVCISAVPYKKIINDEY
jgi:transposase-like protein